ncbi:THAP domain-containing protein 2-like [Aricia agestis]|uniref:THAP domain-containing protein 2-like n=2 Tax=Aricia agestis TaxID=91739 RepID=UPI001C208BEE|nr:THAP domain-containing protein 2-like [Aricia agestis]XP_041971857.1 THAP domain-containing protein 2-like [Aricia agestis]XP_041985264.1 THAP domain-containing protein 2-like [Aricia agestis]XP_041989088.1 THAP domain-containing protein 2-like [Aricia agestis]
MSCVLRGCKSAWYPNCGVKFHGFPSDPDLRQAWLSKIPLKSNYYKSARICSLHFRSELEDYDVNRPDRLLKSAIPKICGCCETLECLNIPSSSQETPCAKASAMPILEKYLDENEPPKKKQIVEVQEAIVLPVCSLFKNNRNILKPMLKRFKIR